MRVHGMVAVAALAALSGCGIENLFNVGRPAHHRPASIVRGKVSWPNAQLSQFYVTDADLNRIKDPGGNDVLFDGKVASDGTYELRLYSTKYQWLFVHARVGNAEFRTIVPELGPESSVENVDLNTENTTETLITEARISHDRAAPTNAAFKKLTPAAYVGNGVDSGTRTLIHNAFAAPGPTQELLAMVNRIVAQTDPTFSVPDPWFFNRPVLNTDPSTYVVAKSPLLGSLFVNAFDYDGDGVPDHDSSKFDAKLAEVAPLYQPAGCKDPNHLRLVFTVDFTTPTFDGTCASVNRYKWAQDKPGKSMFFTAWLYVRTPPGATVSNDPAIGALVGNGVPNQIPMYDDGTNGDEVAGDGIWTVYFDVPYDPSQVLRLGYKYTWGTRGQSWTGSEEWPGNGRMMEVVDENGDGFVYKRDVFGDEATNKDFQNLNPAAQGSIGWSTDLHGCGYPESHERPWVEHTACQCGTTWFAPQAIGPITVACTGP